MKTLRILHLEDDQRDAELACAALEDDGIGCEIVVVQTREEFEAALAEDGFDLILADYSLPEFDGLSALELTRKTHPKLPFILLSGAIGEERAVEVLKSGATDYVLKHRLERLVPVVRRAMHEAEERSEREQAEEALRRSEERYRAVVEQATDGIYLLDVTTRRVLETNYSLQRMLGYTVDELLGMRIYDLIAHTPEDIEYNLKRTMQEGRRFVGERKYRHKDGSVVPVEVGVSTICYVGKVVVCVIVRDITERKKAEEELIRLASFPKLNPSPVIETTLAGEMTYLNPAAMEWFPDLSTLGSQHPLLADLEAVYYEIRTSGDRTCVREIQVGDSFYQQAVSLIPVRELLRLHIIDVTQRRRAEEDLRKSYALLRSVIEGTSDAIYMKDTEGRYLLANTAAANILGRPAEELVGKDDTELLPSEIARSLMEVDRLVMNTGEMATVEEDVPVKGTTRVFLSTKAVYRDYRGNVGGVIGISTDITDRKRTEAALQEIREAERSRIARDLHDGALQDLTYAMQMLQVSAATSPSKGQDTESDEVLATLRRAVRELRAAVYDLRLEAIQDGSFVRSVEALVERNRHMNPELELELEVGEGFPEKIQERMRKELLRIVQEALTNVRRHSGARHASVVLKFLQEMLCVEVSDEGRGFDLRAVPVGLGIRSMRERVQAVGGDLEIWSEPGEGTRVQLKIPLKKGVELEKGQPEEARILLVEDHASVRQGVAYALEREPGFEVVGQAGSLVEGREMLDGGEVDVAIIDLGLPDGYGGELIKELRAKYPQAQALVLSANLDRAEVARAVENGAAGVLHKSVGMNEVVDAVRRLRSGQILLSLEEVVELLRFASSHREQENEARRAIAQLTPRERAVLQALAEGFDGKGIADQLTISPVTERNHMSSIFAKLGVHSRLQALVFALRYGVVDLR